MASLHRDDVIAVTLSVSRHYSVMTSLQEARDSGGDGGARDQKEELQVADEEVPDEGRGGQAEGQDHVPRCLPGRLHPLRSGLIMALLIRGGDTSMSINSGWGQR